MKTSHFYTKILAIVLIVSFVIPGTLFLYPKKVAAESASCAATYLASLVGLTAKKTAVTAPAVTASAAATAAAGTAAGVAAAAVPTSGAGYPVGWYGGGVILGAIATIGASAVTVLQSTQASEVAAQQIAITAAGGAASLTFSECILKPIALQLARAMLHNITGDIIKWVNGGFKGKPLFVTDLKGLIDDTTDQVVGNFIQNELKAGFLCNSFSFQVKIALAQSYVPYRQRAACTLTQITNNVNGFIQNDNNGGWENWLQVTTVPQNNVYGATILAQDELSKQVLEKLKIKSDTLSWGKGFLGVDTCLVPADGVSNAVAQSDPNDPSKCKSRKNETPGAEVEAMLSTAVGSDMRRLEMASDINAIIGAVANQLVSQIIKGGVGLLGAKTSSVNYSDATNPRTDAAISAAVNSSVSRSSMDNGFNSSVGVETTSTNLALYADVTTSLSMDDSSPLYATDGDVSTIFASTNNPDSYLVVDLRSVKSFSTIRIIGTDPVSDSLSNLNLSVYNTQSDVDASLNPTFTRTVNSQNGPAVITVNGSGRFIKIQKAFGGLRIAEIEVIPNTQTTNTTVNSTGTNSSTAIKNGATLSWTPVTKPTQINVSAPLYYEINLLTDLATSSLRITTKLQKNGFDVPLLSVFSSVQITAGQINGMSANHTITSQNEPGLLLTGISVTPQQGYKIKYSGQVSPSRSGGSQTGTFTLVTTAEYSNGTVIVKQSDDFVVQ